MNHAPLSIFGETPLYCLLESSHLCRGPPDFKESDYGPALPDFCGPLIPSLSAKVMAPFFSLWSRTTPWWWWSPFQSTTMTNRIIVISLGVGFILLAIR